MVQLETQIYELEKGQQNQENKTKLERLKELLSKEKKRATNHFILNWNKMFERRGWRATKRARATATRARDGDKGDGNGDNVGDGDGNEGGG